MKSKIKKYVRWLRDMWLPSSSSSTPPLLEPLEDWSCTAHFPFFVSELSSSPFFNNSLSLSHTHTLHFEICRFSLATHPRIRNQNKARCSVRRGKDVRSIRENGMVVCCLMKKVVRHLFMWVFQTNTRKWETRSSIISAYTTEESSTIHRHYIHANTSSNHILWGQNKKTFFFLPETKNFLLRDFSQ